MGAISGAQAATIDMSRQAPLNADLREAMRAKAEQVQAPAKEAEAALKQGNTASQQASARQVRADEITTAVTRGDGVTLGSTPLSASLQASVERQSPRVADAARAVGPTAGDAVSRARIATEQAASMDMQTNIERVREQIKNMPDPAGDMATGYVSGMRIDRFV